MAVTVLTKEADWDEALAKGGVAILDCFATWCGPCKMLSPILDRMANEDPDVKFYKIDVDELPDLAANLRVKAMPTVFFFKDGKKVQEVVGANPKAIEAAVAEAKKA